MNSHPFCVILNAILKGAFPFVALDFLKLEPTIPARYFHDLESLFLVMCWLSTTLEGPCEPRRFLSSDGFEYRDTYVAAWNEDGPFHNSLDLVYSAKFCHTGFEEDFKKLLKEFAKYFEDMKDCMTSLRTLLWHPLPHDKTREKLKAVMDKCWNDTTPDQQELMKKLYNLFPDPIGMRPPTVVLDSFVSILDKAAGCLTDGKALDGCSEVANSLKG